MSTLPSGSVHVLETNTDVFVNNHWDLSVPLNFYVLHFIPNMNTTVKTIKVLHTPNGKSVWKFCVTSDNSYICRKNGWMEVKTFKSWNQMLFQYNRWLEYTNHEGHKTFISGYPKKDTPTVTKEVTKEDTVDQSMVDCLS